MNENQPAFVIGRRSSDHVAVAVSGRSHPGAEDYWDGNWVNATITISVGGFRGRFGAFLRTSDFVDFRQALAKLYESLSGDAQFKTMEEQLSIDVNGDGRGHLRASCEAMDEAGIGNRLRFNIEFDQTEMPAIMRGLDTIISAHPTRGSAE